MQTQLHMGKCKDKSGTSDTHPDTLGEDNQKRKTSHQSLSLDSWVATLCMGRRHKGNMDMLHMGWTQ